MKSTKGKNAEFKAIEKLARDKTNWKNRLEAIHKMRRIKDERVEKIITDMALHDRVFSVKKEAYKTALRMGIQINGRPIFLRKKDDE